MAGNAISIIIQAQDQASQTFKVISTNLEEIKKGSTGAAEGFGQMALKLAAIAGVAVSIERVASAIKDLGTSVVGTAGKFERMKVQLDTLTGGQGAGKLEELNAWAKKMPINTEAALQAFIRLKAMGLEPTIQQMTILSDTASALGGSTETFNGIATALGQIATKGKVSAEELTQLAERGIPVYEILAQKLGMTASEVANIGDKGVSSKKAIAAIFEGLSERFGGQSARMLTTWDGIMEALKSEWVEFEREIAKAGLFDFAKTQAQDLMKAIQAAAQSGELQKLAADIAGALVSIGQLAAGFVKLTAEAAQFARENGSTLATLVAMGAAAKTFVALEAAVLAVSVAQKSLAASAAAASAAMGGSTAAQATAALAAMEAGATKAAAAMTTLKVALAGAAAAFAIVEWYRLGEAIGKASVYQADAAAQTQRINKARAEEVAWLARANTAMGTNFSSMEELNKALANGTLTTEQMAKASEALGLQTYAQAKAMREAKQYADAQAESMANLEKITKQFKDVDFSRDVVKQAKEAKAALDMLRTDPFASQRDRTQGIKAFLDKLSELKLKAPEVAKELDKLIPSDLTSKANDAAAALGKIGVKSSGDLAKEVQDLIRWMDEAKKSGKASGQELADAYQKAIDKISELAKTRPEALKNLSIPVSLKDTGVDEFLQKIKDRTKDFTAPIKTEIDKDSIESQKQKIRDGDPVALRAKIDGQDLKKEADKATKDPIDQKVQPKVDEAAKAQADAVLDQFRLKPSTHTVNPDVAAAHAAIEELKKPTESTHTIHVRTVEGNATGGVVGRCADGGGVAFSRPSSPYVQRGGGRVDDVPAMLMRDEFVMRQSAVRKYGVDLMYALNSGRIPVGMISSFALGGVVGNSIPITFDTSGHASHYVSEYDTTINVYDPTQDVMRQLLTELGALVGQVGRLNDERKIQVSYDEKKTKGGVGHLDVQQLADGGHIGFRRLPSPLITQGSGVEDDVPALLMRNEFVMRQSAVRRYGLPLMYALNEGRLPIEMIQQFNAGGLVFPRQFLDVVPRFAGGGPVSEWLGGWLRGLTAYSAIPAVPIDVESIVSRVSSNLRIADMTNNSQTYLAGIMRTFSGVYPKVFDVGKKSVSSVSLSNASASLLQQKALIEEEYQGKIDLARETGNTELQSIWENELQALQSIIAALLVKIQELKESYEDSIQTIKEDTDSELADVKTKAQQKIEELTGAYGADIANKMRELNEAKSSLGRYAGTYIGSGRSAVYNRSGTRVGAAPLGQREAYEKVQTLTAELRAIQSEYDNNIREARESAEGDASETKKTYRQDRREADTGVKQDIRSEQTDAIKEGQSTKLDAEKDLKSTFLDYLGQIQEYQVEMKKVIQELVSSSTSMNISGFSHWLANGGLVGRYAEGGFVSGGQPGKDSVPAMLMPGEVVLRKRAVDSIGRDYALYLNSLGDGIGHNFSRALRFAEGGEVPGALRSSSAAGENLGTINFQVGGESFQAKMEAEASRALRKKFVKLQRGMVS